MYLPRSGSIKYTQDLKDQNQSDKPTWKGRALRKTVRAQIKRLKDLQAKIDEGIFDGGVQGESNKPETIAQCVNTYQRGFNANNDLQYVNAITLAWTLDDLLRIARKPHRNTEISYNVEYDNVSDLRYRQYYFTFIYIDAVGTWHLINFAGTRNDKPEEFFTDSKVESRRSKLENAIDNLAGKIENDRSKRELTEQDEKVENRSQKLNKRIDQLTKRQRAIAKELIDKDIDILKRLIDEAPQGDEIITDREGTRAIRRGYKVILQNKENTLDVINTILDDWESYKKTFDNNFFTKCLAKADTAAYTTLSECNVVNFSFKARLFRRISGRQKVYGEEKMREYSFSDNGVKSRMAFFRMQYQEYQPDGTFGQQIILPYICAIRHGSESDFYTQLGFQTNKPNSKWRFKFTPVYDILAEIRADSFFGYFFLENTDTFTTRAINANETIFFYGRYVDRNPAAKYYPNEPERGPIYTNEWDMFSVNSDTQTQFSFESGPEIQLTAVTEQQIDGGYSDKYQNLSMIGLGVFANRGLQDLRNITALVRNGKKCRTVENPTVVSDASSSYAPDIFVDTLLDPENGLGKYIDSSAIDQESLILAKSFCDNNNLPGGVKLFMDGLIGDVGSWREFWITNAPFSLLELARKRGKDTLVPALPVNSDGAAADNSGLPVPVEVSALFTAGNILEGTYKEEFLNYGAATEDLIASVIYRDFTTKEIFSKNKVVEVRLEDASSTAIRETFDLSQFVTQREQAIMFGKLLCNQRRHIRKGIEFSTFPSQAPVEPGSFIYVDAGLKYWDEYSSGIVMAGGELNTPLLDIQPADSGYSFLLYDKTTGAVERRNNVTVTKVNGQNVATSLADQVGKMFVMGKEAPNKRVYRVVEVALEEEGEVSIKAIEYPCFEESGATRAKIADFRSSKFVVS